MLGLFYTQKASTTHIKMLSLQGTEGKIQAVIVKQIYSFYSNKSYATKKEKILQRCLILKRKISSLMRKV